MIDLDGEISDHAIGDEPANAFVDGRRRQLHRSTDIGQRSPRIVSENFDDFSVNVIHVQ
ncbi:hypothetical protein D3C71_2089140 [compost metagenome]